MAPETAGNTSMRPLSPAERRVPVDIDSFSAALRFMSRAYGTIRPRSSTGARTHGKEMRDLRQGTAVRTQRQPREESHQPAVPAEPADRAGEGRVPGGSRSRVHSLPADPRSHHLNRI